MTAIEELRKKLDELGIEHDHLRGVGLDDRSVVYVSKGVKWAIVENPKTGMLNLTNYVDELSLEQVIRATIGDEPTSDCDDEDNELLPCPFCGGDSLTISVDGGIAPDYLDFDTQAKIWAENKYVTTCTVTCESCGATVQGYEARKESSSLISAYAMLDCFDKWNRRVGK